MKDPALFENQYARICLIEPLKTVTLEWLQSCSGKPYREAFRQFDRLVTKHRGENVVLIGSTLEQVTESDRTWLKEIFIPMGTITGVKRIQMVVGKEIWGSEYYANLIPMLRQLFEVERFDGLNEAKNALAKHYPTAMRLV